MTDVLSTSEGLSFVRGTAEGSDPEVNLLSGQLPGDVQQMGPSPTEQFGPGGEGEAGSDRPTRTTRQDVQGEGSAVDAPGGPPSGLQNIGQRVREAVRAASIPVNRFLDQLLAPLVPGGNPRTVPPEAETAREVNRADVGEPEVRV